jgi:hypothetical protein
VRSGRELPESYVVKGNNPILQLDSGSRLTRFVKAIGSIASFLITQDTQNGRY